MCMCVCAGEGAGSRAGRSEVLPLLLLLLAHPLAGPRRHKCTCSNAAASPALPG